MYDGVRRNAQDILEFGASWQNIMWNAETPAYIAICKPLSLVFDANWAC